jgi:hypothetical protein
MKIKVSLNAILCITILLSIAWSCQKEEALTPIVKNYLSEKDMIGMTKLGKKLDNPYSVENMQKAWSNLKVSNTSGRVNEGEIEITTTHLYLKFKPQNEEELAILKADSTITFYEYPLDFEILQEGGFYRDPTVPLDQPTFRYCAVPVDKQLPDGVEYESLADLFIPDEYKDESQGGRLANAELIEELVEEALRITGNLDEKGTSNGRVHASDWRPAGTIRVWDNSISPANWRPVEGVEVKARRWFTTHEGRTNAQGRYSCDGTFKRDANYSLDWERYNFALREGWLDGANINGPKKKGDWNLDFSSGANMFHARIFMAAYHYYYKDIKGLRRPPENGTFKTQMRIRCYNESNSDSDGNHKEERRFLGLGSQIKIYNPQNSMGRIYGVTIHELAHASHWNMWRDGEDFNNSEKIVKESWASGVEWEITRMVYPSYSPGYGRKKGGSSDPFFNYTGIVQDLIDGVSGYDQVEGYTIREIEDALRSNKTWNNWRDNIKNSYNNGTENNLDALFDYWN